MDCRTYKMRRCFYNAKAAKSLPYITEPIVNEILTWLPAQDLVRYKTVCKLWRFWIDDPKFIDLHKNRARKSIVGTSKYPDYLPLPASDGYGTLFSAKLHGRILGSSSCGFVCVKTPKSQYQILNPATGKSLQLPPLKSNSYAMEMRLYPNPQSKVLNAVAICKYRPTLPDRSFYWARFTIGVDSEWRCQEFPLGAVSGGTVVWWTAVLCESAPICLIKYRDGSWKELATLTIDPFTAGGILQTAPFYLKDDYDLSLEAHEWDGKFSISRVEKRVIQTWVLDDNEKNEWSYRTVIAPSEEEISVCLVQQPNMWYTSCRNGDLFCLDLVTKNVQNISCNDGRIYDYKGTLETLENMI